MLFKIDETSYLLSLSQTTGTSYILFKTENVHVGYCDVFSILTPHTDGCVVNKYV
jgi:hypothetical protein